jgi:polysaccharide biosynthesis/export protein VpsN
MPSAAVAAVLLMSLVLSGCESLRDRFDPPPPPASRASYVPPGEYRLNTGDVVSVRVYGGDEEIRLERVRLDHSGALVLPFGTFKVQGRTPREVESDITNNIKGRLLKNPRVSVNIDEDRPFFVDGQVGRPGAYPYQPGLTVRKAITIAGGLRERASSRRIFLLPESDKSGAAINVDLNTPVGPGDTINVEESFF